MLSRQPHKLETLLPSLNHRDSCSFLFLSSRSLKFLFRSHTHSGTDGETLCFHSLSCLLQPLPRCCPGSGPEPTFPPSVMEMTLTANTRQRSVSRAAPPADESDLRRACSSNVLPPRSTLRQSRCCRLKAERLSSSLPVLNPITARLRGHGAPPPRPATGFTPGTGDAHWSLVWALAASSGGRGPMATEVPGGVRDGGAPRGGSRLPCPFKNVLPAYIFPRVCA